MGAASRLDSLFEIFELFAVLGIRLGVGDCRFTQRVLDSFGFLGEFFEALADRLVTITFPAEFLREVNSHLKSAEAGNTLNGSDIQIHAINVIDVVLKELYRPIQSISVDL
ncbi:hypothetical protein C5E45_17090 [Nocardia nova]|uniref:Uncharacterized protein n=1 Tax=Nocardia nova TaxID=37330 RepID=A0A2S6AP20_9NOCA|nr:hypothetical protein C5E41_12875 [Nocardia nova]PPJ36952.1 hypothetical protein C5E45_17090 [Nocardia nova]